MTFKRQYQDRRQQNNIKYDKMHNGVLAGKLETKQTKVELNFGKEKMIAW